MKIKSLYIGVGLFILVSDLHIVFGYQCKTNSDCEWCGFCTHNMSDSKCINPFSETVNFIISNNKPLCILKDNLCEKLICHNKGRCTMNELYAGPACLCDYSQDFIGQHCDIRWHGFDSNYWYSGFAVVFDNLEVNFYSGEVYAVSVIISMFSMELNLQFYLETSEGYTIRFNKPTTWHERIVHPYKRCAGCEKDIPKSPIIYNARVLFPYKLALGPNTLNRSVSADYIVNKGVNKGYVANITLVGKILNVFYYQEVFRNTYPVVVDNEDLYSIDLPHLPEIQLENCGRNLEERTIYFKRSFILLNANIKHLLNDQIKIVWAMWDVQQFRDYYEISDLSLINERSWLVEPSILNFTIYRVELKVTSFYSENKALANYADCYFEVKKSKLVAKITGGNRVTVNNKYYVIISGRNSYDPNTSKRNQQDLKFVWSCRPKCDHLIQTDIIFKDIIVIPSGAMDYGKTYNFTLKVSSSGLEDGWAYQEVYVSHQEIHVICLMNNLEKVVPSDPLLLEVRLPLNDQINHVFHWTKIEENGTEVNTDDIKCTNYTLPSYLLCIEPNTLTYGNTYYFKVKLENTDADAGIQVMVDPKWSISCVIFPTKGLQLKTMFSISCLKPSDSQQSWVFEFFDKYDYDLDVEFSGRMMATNSLGVFQNFEIVRGTVVVYLFDEGGVISKSKHVVELIPYNATKEDIEYLFSEIEHLVDIGDVELALKRVSLVSDLVNNKSDKNYIAKRVLQLISKVPFQGQAILKFGLRTVTNFINALTKEGDFTFDQNMLSLMINTINSLMEWTNYAIGIPRTATPYITKEMFEHMATTSVEAIETLFTNRKNEGSLDTSLDNLSSSDYKNAWEASRNTELALCKISYALNFRQAPGYIKSLIKSASKRSSITAYCDYSQIITKNTNKDEINPLKMSKRLIKELSIYEELTIHLTSVTYNPFLTSGRDISTVLLNVDLYNKSSSVLEMTQIHSLKNNIDLFLKVLSPNISSITVTLWQLDPIVENMGDFDENVTVFRFDLASDSKLFMSFSFFNSSDKIKIYVSKDLRPTYDLVNSSGTIISSSNPDYMNFISAGSNGQFVYVGLLPGPNVPINGSINFTMNFYYQLCLIWFRQRWVSRYCKVGSNTSSSNIHCSCSHLSFFSGVFAVPPNEINPFIDIQLFLTIKDNWLIVVFMLNLVILFFFLGVWAKCKDSSDKVQRKVLDLEDNLPGDNNCYLLAVFTGCRINAGTSSNVGVQIYGNESSSHCHILKSSKRKVLQCNSEDWFLFRTPKHLGGITKIHIWHDNSRRSPDWYCNKIIVYDLQTSVMYTFFVEQWLALESSEYCEALLLPATSEDLIDIRRIFMENMIFGFRYVDLGCSILASHPRSRIIRLDKVLILMNFTMIALLVSLAFYKYTTNPDSEGIDSSGFTYGTVDIIISIETFLITSIVILIISYIFSKAYISKHKDQDHKSVVYTRQSKKKTLSVKKSPIENIFLAPSRKRQNRSYYNRLVKSVQMSYNRLPLRPVTLYSYDVKTNRILYFIAWLVSVLLITSCIFFIILYGLKLGQKESKTWLATIFLTLLQEFLIFSPFKIALVALLLASNFERFVQISNYNVNIEDLLDKAQSKTDLNYLVSTNKRTHPMYKPISLMQCDFLRKKLLQKKSVYNLLDFLIVIVYIIIICLVTYDYAIDVQSHSNLHAAMMVQFKQNPKHINFQDVYNRTLYYNFLNINLVNAIFAIQWYNNKTLKPLGLKVKERPKWWTIDKITKSLGPTVFRQIRVDPKKCSLNKIMKNSSVECIPNWEPDVEDDDDYGYGWNPLKHEDIYSKTSAWKYVVPSQSVRLERQGPTWTKYHGGGYITSVSSDNHETEFNILTLTQSAWINEFTRVIFLDFILFNVNKNMFTEVVLIAEHLPFGLYVTRTMINSEKFDVVQSGENLAFILFVIIIVFHIIKILWFMNREGFVKFCSKFENVYQILVTGFGVLSVVLHVWHLKVSVDYVERFQRRGFDEFFNFEEFVYYSVISTDCLTILFCCLCFRLLTLWPFGGSSLNMYYALLLSVKTLARFLVLVILYIYVFCRCISYLLNHMLSFSAFYWDWTKTVHKPLNTLDSFIIFFLSFSVKVFLLYILVIFCYLYKLEKVKKRNQSDLMVLFKWLTRANSK